MVYLLLSFITATRTTDWMLHLSAVRAMLPWYFAYDRINYSIYMSTYWLEMICLDDTHLGKIRNISLNMILLNVWINQGRKTWSTLGKQNCTFS